MADRDLVVLGSLNMDLVIRTERFPEPGETLLAGPFASHPGGKGANQAVAAARLGGRVALIGCVGDDAHGEELHSGAEREGVDCSFVRRHGKLPTGVALITVDKRGENHILVAPGANAAVGAREVEDARAAIEGARALLMQLEIPLEAVERGARIARDAGILVLLNAAPARDLAAELLALVDVLVVNRSEAEVIARSGGDVRELARRLAELGPERVVVTLGARGAIAFERSSGETLEQSAFEVAAVDSTAAGDALAAALALSLARDVPPGEALARACAAGALACTKHGAQPSLPSAAELESFLRRVRRAGTA